MLRAFRQRLPHEQFIYLGDTARLPYGTKSGDSVLRYSIQAAEFLIQQGIKYLVIACNTASSVAVEPLRERFAPMPVIGVIEPGSIAGCAASRSGHIAVLATEGTVRGGAYQRAIARLNPNARVVAQACSLFVALAEEGWTDGAIAEAIAHRYVDELFRGDPQHRHVVARLHALPGAGGGIARGDRSIDHDRRFRGDDCEGGAGGIAGSRFVEARRAVAAPILQATDSPERFARVGSGSSARRSMPGESNWWIISPSTRVS